MIDNAESVVRVLFPNKIHRGRVMGGAFSLRAQRAEEYISVFRYAGPTFNDDIMALDKGRNLDCAKMQVADIRAIHFEENENVANCDVMETGNIEKTSHAGVVVYINGMQLVGGHESDIELKEEYGNSLDILVLAMQHRLAVLAQKGLTQVNSLIM